MTQIAGKGVTQVMQRCEEAKSTGFLGNIFCETIRENRSNNEIFKYF